MLYSLEEGIKKTFEYNELEDRVTIKTTQDVEPILEFNKEMQKDKSYTRTKEMRYVAEIPNIVIEQWLKEGYDFFSNDPDMKRKIKQRLNDPEYRYLRTDLSRI